MRISKTNILMGMTCVNAFILTSTLYSSIDFIAYISFAIHFFILILTGNMRKINKIEFSFFLFISCILVSLAASIDFYASLVPTIYLSFLLLASLVLSKSITNISELERFLYFGILGLVIFNIRNFLVSQESYRFVGVTGQPNALGLVSGTSMMLGIAYLSLFSKSRPHFYRKMTSLILILTSSILIILSGSRGAIVSVLLALVYFWSRSFKYNLKLTISFITSISIITLVYWNRIVQLPIYSRILAIPSALGVGNYGPQIEREYQSAADDIRVDISKLAFEGFQDRPFFGNGLNTFNYYSDFSYTHSTHLEILFTLGLFGTLYFYVLAIKAFRATNNTKSHYYSKLTTTKNTIIVYFILAGVSVPNYQNKSQIIIYVFLLISINLIHNQNLYNFRTHTHQKINNAYN